MSRFIFMLLSFFLAGCQSNESVVTLTKPDLETLTFDVVQKQLVTEPKLPQHVQGLLSQWFNEKVKIDGFDGDMTFTILEYLEETSSINDGKRVDLSLSFKAIINKPSLSQTQIIEGSVFSFGTLTGNFSLEEFDTIIQNAQSDLFLRLSRDLKSKI